MYLQWSKIFAGTSFTVTILSFAGFFLEDHEKNAHKLQKFIATRYVDSVIKHLPATKDRLEELPATAT